MNDVIERLQKERDLAVRALSHQCAMAGRDVDVMEMARIVFEVIKEKEPGKYNKLIDDVLTQMNIVLNEYTPDEFDEIVEEARNLTL